MNVHFPIGTVVALIHSGWGDRSITKRTVTKVRKDLKFFVSYRGSTGEVVQSDAMWTPDRFGGPKAQKSGERGSYSREYIEVWTPKHDEEIAERKARREADAHKAELIKGIQKLSIHSEADRNLVLNLLALLPPPEVETQ